MYRHPCSSHNSCLNDMNASGESSITRAAGEETVMFEQCCHLLVAHSCVGVNIGFGAGVTTRLMNITSGVFNTNA